MAQKRRKFTRQGKPFEAEISASLKAFKTKHPDFFWHKLADTYSFMHIPNMIAPRQPADFFCLYNGKFYLLEAKSLHTTSFPLEHLEEHQKVGLLEACNAGGKGFILFSFRKDKPVRCYATPIELYVWLEKDAVKEAKKSIPEEDIRESSIEIKRIPRIGWNLEPLLLS